MSFALALAARTCCWFRKRRHPKIRCNLRGSKVVRCSAGPGVFAGGTGGSESVLWCSFCKVLAEMGSDDAAMRSSSEMTFGSGVVGGD
eukprot:scaffold83108_cov73-Cyclotella_meneghiniana.AAC.7